MGVEHIKFIVTLPPEDFKKLSNTDNEKNLINLGKIKIDDGASLYQECDALFLPTLLECFSASYAEAMVMHKPILTSNLGFSHTVCGDAAIYFDPMNPKDMAAKIIEVYENKELQRDLIAKGKKQLENFGTAEDRAVRILKICEEIVHENEK
jgi:glycosyltransferase involved in cell wall biosynthesis